MDRTAAKDLLQGNQIYSYHGPSRLKTYAEPQNFSLASDTLALIGTENIVANPYHDYP